MNESDLRVIKTKESIDDCATFPFRLPPQTVFLLYLFSVSCLPQIFTSQRLDFLFVGFCEVKKRAVVKGTKNNAQARCA